MSNPFGGKDEGEPVDAAWVILCAFIVWTMQPGFVLLESGFVGRKNYANVAVRNLLDVIIGGLAYCFFGYAFSFGSNANGMSGSGYYFTSFDFESETAGYNYAFYALQLSYAVKINSIMSGAVTERIKLVPYMIIDFINIAFIFVIPAHWIWDESGWLRKMGAFDFGGAAVIHITGGIIALVGALMVGPRDERFGARRDEYQMSNPVYPLLATLVLLTQWIGFNCGATVAVSGAKWIEASRVAVVTVNGAIGGGMAAILLCATLKQKNGYLLDISLFITGILGGLVGITGGASVYRPWEGIVIGAIGGMAAIGGLYLLEKLKVDDPVGAFPVHCCGGIWSMIAVGFFAEGDGINNKSGIFRGGNGRLLGYNLLASAATLAWCVLLSGITFLVLRASIGIRLAEIDENKGSDFIEHGLVSSPANSETSGLLPKGYHSISKDGMKNEKSGV